jgi:hypothetical protein
MFVLPMLTSNSLSPDNTFLNATAMAGHTTNGAYCECGSPDCICDLGETPPDDIRSDPDQNDIPGQPDSLDPTPDSDSGLGVGMLFGALLLALLFRMMS